MTTAQQQAMKLIKKQITLTCIKIAKNKQFKVSGPELCRFLKEYFKTLHLNILQEEKTEVRRIVKSNNKKK